MKAGKLVGRGLEVSRFEEQRNAALHGNRKVLVVEAEPGLGKTMLIDHLVDLIASSEEAAEPAKRWTIIRAEHDRLAAGRPLAGFHTHIPPYCWSDGENASESLLSFINDGAYDVIDRYCTVVEKQAIDGPVLIAVDDLQFSDPTTYRLLAALLRRLDGLPALFILASRTGTRPDGVDELLRDCPANDTVHIGPGPLDAETISALATSRLGRPITGPEERALQRAGGSPLFVQALVDRFSREAIDEAGANLLTREFRTFVLNNVIPLRGKTRQYLEIASLTERGFRLSELSAFTGVDPVALWEHLREAVLAGLLVETDDGLDFRHDLVKSAIYEEIPAPVARGLHRHVGDVLAGMNADPVRVANHYVLAGSEAGIGALPWLRSAARRLAGHDSAAALRVIDQANELCAPTHPERALLDAERAYALCWAFRFADAVALVDTALPLCQTNDGRLELIMAKTKALLADGKATIAAQTLAELVRSPMEPKRAELANALCALAYVLAGDDIAAERYALPLTQSSDVSPLTASLSSIVQAAVIAGRLHVVEANEMFHRALALRDRDTTGEIHGYLPNLFRFFDAKNVDDFEAMAASVEEGRHNARVKGLSWSFPAFYAINALRLRELGHFQEALLEAETGLVVAEQTSSAMGASLSVAVIASVHHRLGDNERAQRALTDGAKWEQSGSATLGVNELWAAQAAVALSDGRVDEAFGILSFAWDEVAIKLYNIYGRTFALPYVRLLLQKNDCKTAERVAEQVSNWRNFSVVEIPAFHALIANVEALAANSHPKMVEAIELWRSGKRKVGLAEALVDAAKIAASAGLKNQSREYLREATELFEGMGATGTVAEIHGLASTLGLSAKRGRPSVRPASGWASLSPAEIEVARLVAAGRTNREVADVLFVSPRTIETHVSHILLKLGERSRRELGDRVRREVR
jgi:DNA-binding CsgD family transcriptional regulator